MQVPEFSRRGIHREDPDDGQTKPQNVPSRALRCPLRAAWPADECDFALSRTIHATALVCYGDSVFARAIALLSVNWRLAIATSSAALVVAGCDPEPTEPAADPWPSAEQCADLEAWPSASAELERDVLRHIESLRDDGTDCADRGKFGPAPTLVRRAALDCAARVHAQDLATLGEARRIGSDGRDERERVEAAGYSATVVLQHVAAGPRDAQELVEQTWLPRPVPCSSLSSDEVTEIGLGHVAQSDDDFENYWVLVLAAP